MLILDDAFSSVDTYTEETILTNLRQVSANKTTITISHRISTVQDADMTVVMQDGEIVERGKHADLLIADGQYARMYKKQLIESELEAM